MNFQVWEGRNFIGVGRRECGQVRIGGRASHWRTHIRDMATISLYSKLLGEGLFL